ncbi:MAG: hypothetical protein HFJ02_00535 [Bacilli bacterium]|nr:hypothetical protein [Bacilli bacterium]
MNEEYLRRIKYQNLRKNLGSIRNKMNQLSMSIHELESLLKQTLLIDQKIVEEEDFQKLKKDISFINQELNTLVIPMVNNKC